MFCLLHSRAKECFGENAVRVLKKKKRIQNPKYFRYKVVLKSNGKLYNYVYYME